MGAPACVSGQGVLMAACMLPQKELKLLMLWNAISSVLGGQCLS